MAVLLSSLVCHSPRPLCPHARKAHRRAQAQERLVSEAETDLAGQTATTYRLWYRRWRTRSVATADLLNMTWAWRRRAADADFTTH